MSWTAIGESRDVYRYIDLAETPKPETTIGSRTMPPTAVKYFVFASHNMHAQGVWMYLRALPTNSIPRLDSYWPPRPTSMALSV